MSHHGWITVLEPASITPAALKFPFGRLFESSGHTYDAYALSLLSGALGPMQKLPGSPTKEANPAGFTFLGQFIDHDMTEFRVIGDAYRLIPQNPVIGQRQLLVEDRLVGGQVPTCTNGRSGKLDLDSVYGLLGAAQPNLYTDDGLFRLAEMSADVVAGTDIVRGDQFREGRLIADPRNDENKIIVQIHVLFERLHNKIHAAAGGAAAERRPAGAVFAQTKNLVLRIYRQIVMHDYLPRIVQHQHLGRVVDALAAGTTLYQKMTKRNRQALQNLGLTKDEAALTLAIPVEFSHAAFRLGHTQLLNGYKLNDEPGVPLFDTNAGGIDLRGRETITDRFRIDWQHFFDGGITPPQHGAPIDGALPESIFRLPPPAIGEPPVSLAERNIRRGVDFGLPSGQDAASGFTTVYGPIEQTPFEALFPADLRDGYKEILKQDATLAWQTPLWYYIIREAAHLVPNKAQLGPVGGYIVAETLLGSLVETEGFGLPRLTAEFASVVPEPSTLPTAAPADPANIRTMAQLVSFLQAP